MTDELTGAQKAALVILGLDEDVAMLLLRQLEEEDLRLLAAAVENAEPLDADLLTPALEALEYELQGPVIPRAGQDYVRKLTISALGEERAHRIFSPAVIPQHAIDVLRSAKSSTLAELIRDEHPQVGAAVISQLPKESAAALLVALSEETQTDILQRITRLHEIPEEAVIVASEAIAEALGDMPGGQMSQGIRKFDGMKFAADMINEMNADDSDRVLGSLEEIDADLVPKIREAMFTFEDLGQLDTRSLQMLMREVAADEMLIALKTASEPLREAFLSAVSKRAAEAMREDLEIMPPKRLSEVEAAQREIVDTAMQLATDGKLTLPGGGGEELV